MTTMTAPWIACSELAGTENWLADAAEHEDEVAACVDLIRRYAAPPLTLLHLGCGAGAHLGLHIVRQTDLDHRYDAALLSDGEYPLTVFIGLKS